MNLTGCDDAPSGDITDDRFQKDGGDYTGDTGSGTGGTSGKGSSSSSSSSSGWPPSYPDAGAPDLGGEDELEVPPDACTVTTAAPTAPFKTGGYWDQGGWSACGYIALINANIDAGADDTDGGFEQAIRDCLIIARPSIDDADLADGISGAEHAAIRACKEDVMASRGDHVSLTMELVGDYGAAAIKDRCAVLKAAMFAGGSAVVGFYDGTNGHEMRVTGLDCEPGATEITMTFADPNYPTGVQHEITLDCDDKVTSVSPPSAAMTTAHKAFRLTIEVPLQ